MVKENDTKYVNSSTDDVMQDQQILMLGQKYTEFVLKISLFEKIKLKLAKVKQAHSLWRLSRYNTKENSVFNKYLITFIWAKFAVIEEMQLEEGKSRYYSDEFVWSLYKMVGCPSTKTLYKRAINKKLVKFLWRGQNVLPGVLSAFSWEDINRMRLGDVDAKHFWDFMEKSGISDINATKKDHYSDGRLVETPLPENVKEEIISLGATLSMSDEMLKAEKHK